MTRRPRLTRERIEGLSVIADIVRPRLHAKPGAVQGIPPENVDRVRAAVAYIRDIEKWSKDRQ